MSSRHRRWALPALTTLGLLVSGCAGATAPPAVESAAAPMVAAHVTITGHAVVRSGSARPAAGASRSASPTPQVRPSAVPASRPAPTSHAAKAVKAAKRSWARPRPSVSAPARTLLARAHVAAGAPVRVVSVRNVGGRPQVLVTTANDTSEATDAITRAQQAPGAVAVAVDTRVHAADTGATTALTLANDPDRSSQWALTRLDAEDLWSMQPGHGTLVAVVDSGVDASHPDLSGDVISGTDFLTPGGNGFDDENGHGTHVAGIIAATANNSLGIAGLAQGVKILPVRVLDSTGSGWDSDIAQAIDYATDKGASVINLSLGGGDQSSVMATAVSYALSKGVVVVAAAGNDGPTTNTTSYPAAYPGVLAVAASTSSDAIAYFSTRGSYVDVAAPGYGILSTVPGGGYKSLSGTSMATPFAAAAAALIHAHSPSLSPDQVDSILEQTADDLGAPGRDDASGYGLIDPRAALNALPTTVTPTIGPAPTTTQPAPATTAPQPSTEPVPVTAPDPTTTPQPEDPQPTVTGTSTRILSRSRLVRYGSRVRGTVAVSDDAGAPLAGVPVKVCLTVAGAPDTCGTVTTSSSGRAGYVLPVRADTTVTASFGGDQTHAASTSEPVVYTVAPRLTVRRHHRTLTVRLGAQHRRLVTLQRLSHGRWVSTAQARVAPGGRHVFRHLKAGRYRVRVPATRVLPGAHLALRLR